MNRRWVQIADAVERAWGPAARWDLEVSGGVAGEIIDRVRDADPAVVDAALRELLAKPAPRGRVGAVLAKGLREAIEADARSLPSEAAVGNDTPYMRALAAQLAEIAASCP